MLPHLVLQPKWHVEKRNVAVGDVVIFLHDRSSLRGEWIRGVISKIMFSKDDRVRKAEVTYKRGDTSISVVRAVQRLIILVPNEDKDSDVVSENIEESVLDDSSDIETSKRAQKMKVGKVNTADIIKKYVENDATFHENTENAEKATRKSTPDGTMNTEGILEEAAYIVVDVDYEEKATRKSTPDGTTNTKKGIT